MNERVQFKMLSEPAKIGGLTLRNRMIMAPMGTALADKSGLVTEEMKSYYEARARGGAGMIIVENACVDFPQGRHRLLGLCIDGERTLEGLSQVAQLIKKHGARAAIQLHHGGKVTKSDITGLQPVGPSPIPAPGGELPRELTIGEIASIVTRFAHAAELAKRAGFEGIEIHAAHNYLVAQFLSPASNKRLDEYGESVVGRTRLLVDIIEAVRKSVGEDFPVWCRINASELGMDGGLSLNEALEIAKVVESTSADAMSVSAYGTGKFAFYHLPETPGAFIPLAAAVKKVVRQPIIVAGMITPAVGEQALADGKIDIVALGRALIADPEFPNKVTSGVVEDIRPCINCYVCQDIRRAGGPLRCSVNAAAGQEYRYRISPASQVRDVLIIGAGPAGMEAARVAAIRGHRVRMYEREGTPGGQLRLASIPPHKEEIGKLNDYFSNQLRKLDIKVELGKEATPDLVKKAKADTIIMATGSSTVVPVFPGVNRTNAILAQQALEGEVEGGKGVVVIGGGMVGCETAELLEERGKKVTIVEILPELATNMRDTPRRKLLERLSEKSIDIFTGAKCESITDGGLVITDKYGKSHTIEADTVVFATGALSEERLFNALKDVIPELHRAGDCVQPRGIMEAIDEGMQVALEI